MNWTEQALAKLDREAKAGQYDKYAAIMKQSTLDALRDFCRQNEEFAQAVVQGGTLEDCMKRVAKNCGKGISDLDAYQRAVQFYFPGAEVRFHMELDLCGRMQDEPAVVLNLADFW